VKLYTKTGDRGRTGLFSGERVSKADRRVSAYGAVDELNSILGMLAASLPEAAGSVAERIERIQSDLFCIGAWFATTPESPVFRDLPGLAPDAVAWLESEIDDMEKGLPPLRGFILPGGTRAAGWAHLARAVCRRAERDGVAFLEASGGGPGNERLSCALVYLNRLSDYLFVLARHLNRLEDRGDRLWTPRVAGRETPP